MTTTTHTLTWWLLERLAEDEAAALTAARNLPQDSVWWIGGPLDPARSFASIRSVRAIIADHSGGHECPGGDRIWFDGSEADSWAPPCPTLRHLAEVYADHTDYDPSWAVS